MSIAPAPTPVAAPAPAPATGARRVRHQARDAAALMVFSAATSVATAGVVLLLTVLARQA